MFAAIISSIACNKLEDVKTSVNNTTIDDSKIEFVKILSKAISSDVELREFIKSEALSQFDMDYDVFYPFVKDKIVHGGMSFRDILLVHSNEEQLSKIENDIPLLNILVPDWAWLGCFSVNNWDTSEDIAAVGYSDSQYNRMVYLNGECLGALEQDDLPLFPIILVKENERMKVSAVATRSGENCYEFVNEAFNKKKAIETKVDHSYYDRYLGNETADNFMPSSELDPLVIEAYNIFKNNKYAAHRDYIYYDMTETKTSGVRNVHVKEILHKIMIPNLDSRYLFDDENGTGDFNEHYGSISKYNDDLTDEELKNRIWIDGGLELQLSLAAASSDGNVQPYPIVVSASFNDLFTLNKTNVDFKHKTWFSRRLWVHTVDGRDHFIPKWFVINQDLGYMDIEKSSSTWYIIAHEIDSDEDDTYETTYKSTYMKNFKIDGSVGVDFGKINAKVGLGYGDSSTEEKQTKVTINIKKGSDYLGAGALNYMDPIISGPGKKNGVDGYYINLVQTNMVRMMILPKQI